jgi:hypothetical protein
MADRPILFSAPMVRALLDGRKTQTRRILKPQPTINSAGLLVWDHGADFIQGTPDDIAAGQRIKFGDRLWVREAWWIATRYSYGTTPGGCDLPPPPLAARKSDPMHYAADGDPENCANRHYGPEGLRPGSGAFAAPDPYAVWLKKPSIHMPRWASRLTLTVTEVRVERLQDISRGDAIAEGLVTVPHAPGLAAEMECNWGFDGDARHGSPVSAYAALWDHINGPGEWQQNPWVAAYTFTVERKNIDDVEPWMTTPTTPMSS